MAPKQNASMDMAVAGGGGGLSGAAAGGSMYGSGTTSGKGAGHGHQGKGFGGTGGSTRSHIVRAGVQNTRDSMRPEKHSHRPHRKPEQNLNHLLNFSYARPAQSSSASGPPARRIRKSAPSFGVGSGYHPLDKAHFVNANYRFVVRALAADGYKPNLFEADVPIEWENILQVIASAQTQRDNCPICLDSVPVAPRMAKCGHVFCYSCILRYLASEDLQTGRTSGKWRKCPICHDGVYAHELRPVRWFESTEALPRNGEEILLRLIARRSGSMYALPRETDEVDAETVPWHNHPEAAEYARFSRGDEAYMAEAAKDELAALLRARENDGKLYGEEDPWMTIAMEKIEETMSELHLLGSAPEHKPRKAAPRQDRAPIEYTQAGPDTPVPIVQAGTAVAQHRPTSLINSSRALETAADDRYYFYQPRTGCHYYLSPFDIRVLKRAFEQFTSFPDHLIARVEHTHTHSLTEEMRRRTKYLSHLPLGCEVTFLECDWSSVLEEDVLKAFATEIEKRRRTRREKAAQEEAARRRAQLAEERRQRNGGRDLQFDFDEDYLSPTHATNSFDDPALHDFSDSSYFGRRGESAGEGNTFDPLSGSSLGAAGPGSSAGGGSHVRTVWGTQAIIGSASSPPLTGSHDAADGTAWAEQIAQWTEQNEIDRSLRETSLNNTAADNSDSGSRGGPATAGGSSGKSKSKKKKLVLMSTGFTPR